MPFRPIVDGALFSHASDAAIAAAATAGLELLVGTNRDEFRLFTFAQPSRKSTTEALARLVEGYLEAGRYRRPT